MHITPREDSHKIDKNELLIENGENKYKCIVSVFKYTEHSLIKYKTANVSIANNNRKEKVNMTKNKRKILPL